MASSKPDLPLSALTAISPVDGRYGARTEDLRGLFSEYGLIYYRLKAEICWYRHLAEHPDITELSSVPASELDAMMKWLDDFSLADAERVKAYERETNHDVKAVEYWLKERATERPALAEHSEFFHFSCTSEDINNLAYALMLKTYRDEQLLPQLTSFIDTMSDWAVNTADVSMLSRTHGQTASPTTLGKEFANVAARLHRQRSQLQRCSILGKMNGAVGNFNAHTVALSLIHI